MYLPTAESATTCVETPVLSGNRLPVSGIL
jgi:hypothetical protein